MKLDRQKPNHERYRTDSRRNSGSVHHAAKHSKPRSFGRLSRQELQRLAKEESASQQPVPEQTEKAKPEQSAAPETERSASGQFSWQDTASAASTEPRTVSVDPSEPEKLTPSETAKKSEPEKMEKEENKLSPETEQEVPISHKKGWRNRHNRPRTFSSFQEFLDRTLSFRFLCDVFLKKLGTLFVVGVVCSLVFMFVLTLSKSFTASTTMSLNYEESVTGKTPNGARFSESEFLTQEYLDAVLQATGLQDDMTTTELADCISITPTTSKLVTKEDDYYISSSYNLTIRLPWSLWGKITPQDFLDQVCRVYNQRFTADYRTNATSLDINFDYSDMDYTEIGSYFQMMCERINNYLVVRNNQAGSYLSSTGQSYNAIKKQVQNLQGYTLMEYQSYIWENGVAKDNSRCIDDLNELNRTLHWSELSDSQKSDIFMTILDNYNNKMVSSVLIPTYDSDGAFYMSRTKIGIDDLALRANELLTSSVESQKTITTNDSKITALKAPTTADELQVAQAMVDVITQQLMDIVSATRDLDADCYAQRISSYLVFNEPNLSFMSRYNVKTSVMLAAGVCVLWYLAAVVWASSQRQREQQREERE